MSLRKIPESPTKYQASTRELISQAFKVLDGEKSYNNADLDRYLMGIQKIKVEKKSFPKLLPSLAD